MAASRGEADVSVLEEAVELLLPGLLGLLLELIPPGRLITLRIWKKSQKLAFSLSTIGFSTGSWHWARRLGSKNRQPRQQRKSARQSVH
jgi:hypothetical protein